jgi:hypothetical protein
MNDVEIFSNQLQLKTREENQFLVHHQFYLILWLFYCGWIYFGKLTNCFRWIFCVIHGVNYMEIFSDILSNLFFGFIDCSDNCVIYLTNICS